MRIEDLRDSVLAASAKENSKILLVINRKNPPKHFFISVKEMGKGYICNVQKRENGTWDIVASFNTETIKRTLISAGIIKSN